MPSGSRSESLPPEENGGSLLFVLLTAVEPRQSLDSTIAMMKHAALLHVGRFDLSVGFGNHRKLM